ncbi:MAG TPA: hypothetical protein PKA60_01265 [Candidatus Paceibacterota bacterium]|nr:hypothetical protein [Candidatus Paceibacterota bacterium]
MNSSEINSQEKILLNERFKYENALMTGKAVPRNRMENQIRLAADYARILYGEKPELLDMESREFRNKIMFEWSDGEGSLSKFYRQIEDDDNFFTHPRLKGNILNITIGDVLFFKQNNRLPEN